MTFIEKAGRMRNRSLWNIDNTTDSGRKTLENVAIDRDQLSEVRKGAIEKLYTEKSLTLLQGLAAEKSTPISVRRAAVRKLGFESIDLLEAILGDKSDQFGIEIAQKRVVQLRLLEGHDRTEDNLMFQEVARDRTQPHEARMAAVKTLFLGKNKDIFEELALDQINDDILRSAAVKKLNIESIEALRTISQEQGGVGVEASDRIAVLETRRDRHQMYG